MLIPLLGEPRACNICLLQVDSDNAACSIHACRHVDVSSQRGNEAEIGAALSEVFSDWVVSRSDIWLTGKVWPLPLLPLQPIHLAI